MSELLWFPGSVAEPAVVGGKAAALMRMAQEGLPVPPGAVLTTAFFAPWFTAIQGSAAWAGVLASKPEDWGRLCPAVQALVPDLPLDRAQGELLRSLERGLEGHLFAVRSSSPQEDLGEASFAGGYESVLGVTREGVEAALRRCFASSLDARVFHYKRAQGIEPLAASIAVLVQAQIDSEVAGVGFSLDPLTNDYDEAVFDAAWGLGESVVSGAVSPDHFVVDKPGRRVLSRVCGAKQRSLHLDADGGSRERSGYRSGELCLSDAQVLELSALITRVEQLFGFPVDIEWAFADGRLHLLQARAITAWVPLPPEMCSAPGERRRLYVDLGLSGGLTINAPISPIGESWMARFVGQLIDTYLGELPMELGPEDQLWFLRGGRMYQDLSNVLRLIGPRRLAKAQESGDALMAATLANIDADRYRAQRRPAWLSPWLLIAYPRAVWRARRLLGNLVRAALRPERARARFDQSVERFEAEFEALPEDVSLPELIAGSVETVICHVVEVAMPGLAIGLGGVALIERLVPGDAGDLRDLRDLRDALTRGFEGNVVVEMGGALYSMAQLLSDDLRRDPEALALRLNRGELPAPFLAAWEQFLGRYGWRGPNEVDLGSPRYADAPILALRQLCMMGIGDFDPGVAHQATIERRRAATIELRALLGPVRRRLLRRALRWVDSFAGTRDTPKHNYLLLFAVLRRRAMFEGRKFVAAGRLDEPGQVMALTLEEIEAARHDPDLDLRARCSANDAFNQRLRKLVKGFPAVIDSRGRILGPAPRPERPGELRGTPISPGCVRGPIKVLHHADEKPVLPGDILVAHTTDPGWTPLFINAAAVILEVGGVLQHGAVVAREYGMPCVAGISRVLDRLEDGQLVEVDGRAGVVRILKDSSGY